MSGHPQNWRSLPVAIAWIVTRDRSFCDVIETDQAAMQHTARASFRLEREMLEAGCFVEKEATLDFAAPVPSIKIRVHGLAPGYSGRFQKLAAEYEREGRDHRPDEFESLQDDTSACLSPLIRHPRRMP